MFGVDICRSPHTVMFPDEDVHVAYIHLIQRNSSFDLSVMMEFINMTSTSRNGHLYILRSLYWHSIKVSVK